jgi:hypothetical protein
VNTQFAYLLFYMRKDLKGKSLDKVFPSISLGSNGNDWFVGKPVRFIRPIHLPNGKTSLIGHIIAREETEFEVVNFRVRIDGLVEIVR